MDKPTSFDIAQAAGVSQPTVSRALRGSPLVNEATRRRIETIARQLNYTVDKNASSLRTSRSRTLALLFFEDPTPDESHINPFFLSMVGAITRACAAHGYDLLISFQQLSSNWHVDFEDSRKADGILLLGYGDYHLSRARLEALDAQGTHFVRWGSVRDGQPGITIGCDNVAGGRDVTAHLLGLGRRAIAFIGTATDHYPELEDRYTGYARALADAGLVADPAFVQAPGGNWMNMLDAGYLAQRASLIDPAPGAPSMKTAKPGSPAGVKTSFAPMPTQIEYGTSHISIVDAYGEAIAMTTTIEDGFGARQMVRGFLLNNELTDFSFAPTDASGSPIANRVQPGKRPRSSMAPTLVFDKATGELLMSGGSPGGALIIHYTAKILYGVLNWGMLPQQAINLPNFASLNGPTVLEEKRFPAATVDALKARGHEVREVNMTSGLQAITRGQAHGKTLWMGGADPRREGIVMGD